MKLHLPPSLRAALLSCLAVVGGGFTACSGTVAAVGAVTVAIVSASQSYGQWVPPTYTGNVSVAAAATAPLVITQNSTITYTYVGNVGPITATGFDVKLAANTAGDLMTVGANAIVAQSVWFSQGRFTVNGSALDGVESIYAQGGQFFVSGTLAKHLYIGSSTYSGEAVESLKNVALRLEGGANVTGAVDLIEDAVISTYNGAAATFTGALTTGDHLLTKVGTGSLTAKSIAGNAIKKLEVREGTFKYETPDTLANRVVALDAVTLGAGSTLSVHNGHGGAGKIAVYQTIASLTLNGNATLQTTHHAGGWKIANLQGENKTLTIDFNSASSITQYSLIEGGSFSGTLELKQSQSTGTRGAIMGVSNTDLLANTVINMSQKVGTGDSYLAFAVGGAVGNTVKALGLQGVAGTYVVSYNFGEESTKTEQWAIANLININEARTLELTGTGSYIFNGTIGNNLTINKTGTGNQTLRDLGNNVTINLNKGSMEINGFVGTGTVVNTLAGTSISVPWALTGTGDVRTASYQNPTYIQGAGSIVVKDIYGVGDLADGSSHPAYTILDPNGYTGTSVTLKSGLLTVCDGEDGKGAGNADFGTITKFVLDNSGLLTANSAAGNTYTITQDLELKGNGYLRAYGEGRGDTTAKTILTGAITGNGTLTKTDKGEITLAGDLSGFTGGIAIGAGSLAFDTNHTLSSFVMRGNTRVKVIGGHQLTVTSPSFDTGAGNRDMVAEDGSGIFFNRINNTPGNGATVTIDIKSSTNGFVTTNQFTGGNTGNTALFVRANAALNVTGSTITEDHGSFVNSSTFLLSHWQGSSSYTIEGTLNMLNCSTFAVVNPSGATTMAVKSGGVLNLKGLNQLWRDGVVAANRLNLTLESGSMMNLGSAGINTGTGSKYGGINLVLNGGTLGILDSTTNWTTSTALALNGDVTVDTRLYTAATDGKAGTYTNASGTITLSGAITGTGTLLKKGEGTLVLSNVASLNAQEGFIGVSGGNLTIGTLAAMTEDGGRFSLKLGTDKVTAATYTGHVNLNVIFASGGTIAPEGYDVFVGAAGLAASDVNIRYMLDRGLTGSFTVNNGTVKVSLGGTLNTTKYDMIWNGAAGSTWINSNETAWTGAEGSENRFSSGDNVTFNGDGIKDITIVGIVNPGSMTVSGTESYTWTGGSIAGAGALTKSGTGTLAIDSATTDWTGDVNLQGGTLAFRDSLGKSNHINVSGTSTLAWLGGNNVDLSSRIVMAEGTNLTFDTGVGAVIFGTKIATTGNYVKTGKGSLTLNVIQALTGNIVVNQGDLIFASGGSDGAFKGAVTVNNGGRLVLNVGDATGWGGTTIVNALTITEGGSMWINTTANETFNNMVLTLQGGTISGINGARFDLGIDAAGTASLTTLASDVSSVISVAVNIRQTGGVTFNIADGGAEIDLLIKNDLKSLTGDGTQKGQTLTKDGAGTMQVTGNYSAGAITVNGGNLILGNGSLGAYNITLAAGTGLAIKGGTFKWGWSEADRAINNGTITLESDGVMWTNSNWKYHTTLGADATLKGSGKWITGIATVAGQDDGTRNFTINGNTADFTGILEMQGTGFTSDNKSYRTRLVLNSADGILGGVVRMQGVVQNNGWATNDNTVVPVGAELLLKKSMQIGGIEGKGGILTTDVDGGADLTLGDSGTHTFSGSMTGVFKSLTKQGTGTQILDGDLSVSLAGIESITVSGGKLGLGASNYAGNVNLSGTGASLAAGKVTIGAGKTLTVSHMTTVIDGALDLSGGSLVLGTEVGDYSVGLNSHSLGLSSTNKTDLSLVLADDLSAGDLVTLFSGVNGLTNDGVALTLTESSLLSDYFNVAGISGLSGAKLQLSADGKLQIVMARATGALVYGRGNNGVWETGVAFEAEPTATPFTANANALFDKLGTNESMNVQLKGDLTVGAMTIDAGAGNTYSFAQHADGGKIVSLTEMKLDSGTTILGAGVLAPTANTTISVGSAALELANGSINDKVALALANGATLKWGTGNTADYSSLGGITVAASANVTFDLNGNAVELGTAIANSATYTVKGGGLTLANHDVLSGSVILSDAGNLILKETSTPGAAYTLNISGTGDVSISGSNAVTLSGTNSYSGATNVLANARLNVTDTSLSALTSQISLAAGSTFDYTATKDVTLDRKLTGTGNVIFQGAQEITLTGANDYTGTTTISTGTTLHVSNTSIGGAGNAIANSGTLHINTGAAGYTVAQAISGAGALSLQGSALTWNTSNKTYTGNTTIMAGSTVSSDGALTSGALGANEVRLITVENGGKLVLTDAAKTEAWLDNGGSNDSGLFLRGAGTVRLQFTGEVSSAGFIAKALQNAGTLGKLELASGSRLVLSTNQNAKLATVDTIAVESGANITMGGGTTWTGSLLSIAGAGLSGETAGSQKAAALSLDAGIVLSRSLALTADASVFVAGGNYSTLNGAYVGNGHTLTKTGAGGLILGAGTLGAGSDTSGKIAVSAGVLSFNLGSANVTAGGSPYVWQGAISLADGTMLNKHDGYTRIAGGLEANGNVRIGSNWARGFDLGAVSGSGTITLERGTDDQGTSEQLILGADNGFTGSWNVMGLWTLNVDHANALAKASVALGTSSIQMGVAAADLVGLTGAADSKLTLKSTLTSATLGISGAGTNTFSGSVATGVTVDMKGTGAQTLNGSLADGSNFTATAGQLLIASTDQTGSHTFTANGGNLNMQGYTRGSSATGKDSFVFKSGSFSNLTLSKGMEIKAGDAVTGDIVLGGTTVLNGGTMVFRMTDAETSTGSGYYGLANAYSVASGGSISIGTSADKTLLNFVPADHSLDPGDDATGRAYILIKNVGSGITAGDLGKFALNMSSEGRTQYILGLDSGNLILTVKGAAATLTWTGTDSKLWNTDAANTPWQDKKTSAPTGFLDDDLVIFDTLTGTTSETISVNASGVKMGGMTVIGSTSYTFNGGAISSSVGNTNAGLVVGTADNAFTGTLTLNTANSYAGNTTVNSGTVIANNKDAFSNTKLTIKGGTVSLGAIGTLGTTAVEMAGGTLDATGSATVNNIAFTGADSNHTLTASTGGNLTLSSSSNTIAGAWTIGSATDATKGGLVKMNVGTLALTHAQDVTVESGYFVLEGTTGSYTGANIVLAESSKFSLQGGITATIKSLTGTGGITNIGDGATLAFSEEATVAGQIDTFGGDLHGAAGLTLEGRLYLYQGNTSLTGTVALNELVIWTGENNTSTLSVGKSGVAGSVVLGEEVTSLRNINVVNGTLTVKDGDSIGLLTSSGTVTTAATEAALSAGTAVLNAGSSIANTITLTLTGKDSWLGENAVAASAATVGKIVLDGTDASAHLGDKLAAQEITVKNGTLFLDKTTGTVTDGITLNGALAKFDMMSNASSIALEMNQGSLANSGAYTGTITINDTSTTPTGWNFNMGGLTATSLVEIESLTAGSQLTNLQNIRLGDSTISLQAGMKAIFSMTATTGVVSMAAGSELTFVTNGAIGRVIGSASGKESFNLTNGSLSGLMDGDGFKDGVVFDPTLGLYNISASINGGNLVLTSHRPVDQSTIYKSAADGTRIDSYDAMDKKSMVDINADTTIDLTAATMDKGQESDGLILKNLHNTGEAKTTLTITGTADDLVTLDNNLSSTWFNGDINVSNVDLTINNTDASTDAKETSTDRELTIQGKLTSNGMIYMQNGKLVLGGAGNSLTGGMTFNENADQKGVLVVKGNTTLGGTIEGADGLKADILLNNATLTFNDGAVLNAWVSGTGMESLQVQGGGILTIGEDARVDQIGMYLDENRTAVIETTEEGALSFNGISGKGILKGDADASITLNLPSKSSIFSGNLDDYAGEIIVKGAGTQTLATSMNAGSELKIDGGSVTLKTSGLIDTSDPAKLTEGDRSYGSVVSSGMGSKLTLETAALTEKGMATNNKISMEDLNITNGTLTFTVNLTNDLKSLTGVVASVENGANINGAVVDLDIKSVASDFSFRPGQEMTLYLMSGITSAENLTLSSSSLLNKYFSSTTLDSFSGYLYVTGMTITGDTAHFHADAALTENGRAGAGLLDYLYATHNPQVESPDSLAAKVLTSVEQMITSGNKGAADRVMAGVAGSTVTSMSAAFASSLTDRIDSIRNRMTGMGADQSVVNEDLPNVHAWISADGGYNDLSSDSTYSGYSLNTWGGTFGMDVDVNERVTLGAAFSASYGDLTANAAESARGDLDTYTVTAFARIQAKKWNHDFAVAGSSADATLRRTVSYGDGTYSTNGTTTGFGMAAMYEASYSIAVGQNKENLLQPLFRASFTHASMDSYSESQAGEMGLAVGKQSVNYATFGVGARYLANVGQNIYNRNSILELRALVLQDAGSRRGEADVALSGAPERVRRVKGAEPGSTGIQIGAGLTIPVQTSSAIFADVSLNARSKMTTVNGSIGYRITF